jgi:hypothetical protein
MKLRLSMGTCGRCGKEIGNPLRHVCVTRAHRPKRRGRTRIRPKASASAKCGTCGKPYANPLTHVCTVKTDFRRRAAAGKRTAKPGRRRKPPRVAVVRPDGSQEHLVPAACRDEDCTRKTCQAYKDGFAAGVAAAEAQR